MMERLRSMVQHNLPAKIVALIVAVVLWLYVMNDQNPAMEGTYTVPVTIENAPEGYQMSADADSVTIRVRGPRSFFVAAERGDFHARMSLADFTEGTRAYAVEASIPYGFDLVGISPDKINVNLDRIVEQPVLAVVATDGFPAEGFTVAKFEQEYKTVMIEGPRSLVDQVAQATGHINLNGLSSDDTAEVKLVPLNADGREVAGGTLTPSTTHVFLKFARSLSRKVVEVEAHPRSDLPPALKLEGITVEPSRIEIAGTGDVIGTITSIGTEEFSLADVHTTEKRTVKLVLPPGVTVTDPNVTVEIKVGAMK